MSKRKAKKPAARKPSKGKVGGARPGSGPKPALGPGTVREKIKTLRLGADEDAQQQAAVKRAGLKDWATWARPILNAAARGPQSIPIIDDPVPTPTDIAKIGGAVVSGTTSCVCGHSPEEHGRHPEYPGSTACRASFGAEGCDCPAYEADEAPVVAPGEPGTPEAQQRP